MNFDDPKFTTIRHRNVWGEWTFVFEGSKLCELKYRGTKDSGSNPSATSVPSNVQACVYASPDSEVKVRGKTAQNYGKIVKELSKYLTGKAKSFTTPIKLYGTDFQQAVWNTVRKIPYGETRTYKQIAEAIGHPQSERAVGNALHQNPLQVIVPCHRVISSRGKLSGYAMGLDIKRRLLCMEGAIQNELELE